MTRTNEEHIMEPRDWVPLAGYLIAILFASVAVVNIAAYLTA